MNGTPQQLTLGITLGVDFDFARYVAGPNAAAVESIRSATNLPSFIYLWGEGGSGRTHLLHAAARAASEVNRRAAVLPLREAGHWKPEMLEGWEALDLVALDDVEAVAGRGDWESELFALYNGLRDAGATLIVTANAPPAALAIALPDLRSRLAAMLVFHLQPLDDEARLDVLTRKAKARGLELPEESARYLLARVSRDMRDLAALFDRLDRASLAHQRRLTIPFVREQLDR